MSIVLFFSISSYATTNTEDSVFIIGGLNYIDQAGYGHNSNIIARFKHDQWTIAGYLKRARSGHGALTLGGVTMIMGGAPSHNDGLTLVCGM